MMAFATIATTPAKETSNRTQSMCWRTWFFVLVIFTTDATEPQETIPCCFSTICKRALDTGYFLLNATRSVLEQEYAIVVTTDKLKEIGCIMSVLHENSVETLFIKVYHLRDKIDDQLKNFGDQRFVITVLANSEREVLDIFGKFSEITKSSFTWWTVVLEDIDQDFANVAVKLYHNNIVFVKIFTTMISETLQEKQRVFCIFALDKDESYSEGKIIRAKGIWYAKNHSFSFWKSLSQDSELQLDLMGRTLKVSALADYPFLLINTLEDGKQVATYGIDYNILLILSNHFNFTFEIVSPEDRQWGSKNKDGTWTGIIGMVNQKRADFAIGEITITMQREEAVDFSKAYYTEPVMFVCPPAIQNSRALAIIRPFSSTMWGSLLAMLIISTLLLYTISTMEVFLYCENKMTLRNCAWYLFGTYTSQGGHCMLPKGCGSRTMIGFWWLYTIVIVSAYSGILKSFLMMPGPKEPIETIKELISSLREKGFSVGSIDGTFVISALMESQDTRLQTIFEEMNKDRNNFVEGTTYGLKKVMKERYCFICSALSVLTKAAKLGSEKFCFGKDMLFSTSFGIALQEKSPLKRSFDNVISRIVETGIVEKWISDILEELDSTLYKLDEKEPPYRPLNVEDFQGSIYLLLIGYSISLLVLAFEVAYRRTLYCSHKLKRKFLRNVSWY